MGDQWPKYYKTTDDDGWVTYVRIWDNQGNPTIPYTCDWVDGDGHGEGVVFGDSMFRDTWVESTEEEFNECFNDYMRSNHG